MLLTEYLRDFAETIAEYAETGLIIASELKADARAEKIGLIRATIVFENESRLFVTEYVDLRYKIEKLTYSFHYQDKDGSMIFRYDNAKHKPDLGFNSHKHVKEKVLISEVPELKDILEEIVGDFSKA